MESIAKDCLGEILSRTSPGDVLRFAITSKQFQSIADEEMVWKTMWNKFSLNPIVSGANIIDKKNFLLKLGKSHIMIDNSSVFFLDKQSGNKISLAVGAKGLFIEFVDNKDIWRWISDECSRFSEVVWLHSCCLVNIKAKIKLRVLSKNTHYGVYVKYKPRDRDPKTCNFLAYGVVKHERPSQINFLFLYGNNNHGARLPVHREDGWMEIEIGDFHNNKLDNDDDDREALASMRTLGKTGYPGLVFEGIEVRPKI